MKVANGCTRKVFLIGKYAIKIPQISYQWRHFLLGLLANMQEKHFSDMKDDRMCPVLFAAWGGWILIMPRCEEISEKEFSKIDIDHFWEQSTKIINDQTIFYGDCKVPVEHKISSFGIHKGKIVALDYGS